MKIQKKMNRGLKLLHKRGFATFRNTALTRLSLKMKPARCLNWPSFAQIEITTYCNLRCSTCKEFTDQFGSEAEILKHLDFGKFKKIFERLPYLKRVRLNGVGEPLLHPEFLEMIQFVNSKGIEIEFFSNGTMFREEVSQELIKYGVNTIFFSIDGAERDTFERIRKGAKFDEVMQNIRRFVELKKKSGLETPDAVAITTLSKDNISEVPAIVELVHSLGLKKMMIKRMIPWVEELEGKIVSREEHDSIRIGIEAAKRLGIKLNTGSFTKALVNEPALSLITNCMWPWSSTYITVDGWVTPCCNIYDPRTLNFGNIFEKDFAAIWGSEEFKEFRCQIKKGETKICYTACII